MKTFTSVIRDNRHAKAVILVFIYAAVLFAARWLAHQVRFDFDPNMHPGGGPFPLCCMWEIPIQIAILLICGQMYGILRYFSLPDLGKIVLAQALAAGAIAGLESSLGLDHSRGIILLDFVFGVGGLTLVRLAIRMFWEKSLSRKEGTKLVRVAIIGAGDVGAKLANEMLSHRLGMTPAVFLDDNKSKWHLNVHGIPVAGSPEQLSKFKNRFQLDKVVIAMPSASPSRVAEIVRILKQVQLPYETVPSLYQLTTGKVSISRLRPVEIEDLLGRAMISLDCANAHDIVENKVVAVTGAGGSIGSELCRQIAAHKPAKLLLIEQSEPALFQIEQELIGLGYRDIIVPKIADILDAERMRKVFDRYRPNVLFHAAAHKHVPMMEYQPGEAIKNNTFGTATLANLALEFQLDRFVLISTDKAINPTNVMGATKRMAEIYLQSLAAANATSKTKFMAVRFGNVLGSSGSVIPTFKKQIEAGGPVKVTHPEIMRYFMTIPEAVGLVLQAAVIGKGGEIFVLDMGKPVKIVDLARQMIELSGFTPDQDIKIEFTGLRPGEKLFEELSNKAEDHTPTVHPKIARFITRPMAFVEVKQFLDRLSHHVNAADPQALKNMIHEFVPEYKPFVDHPAPSPAPTQTAANRQTTVAPAAPALA